MTVKDVGQAIAEGFDHVETLKRYSTLGMGPCQGKMCRQAGGEVFVDVGFKFLQLREHLLRFGIVGDLLLVEFCEFGACGAVMSLFTGDGFAQLGFECQEGGAMRLHLG